MPTETAIEYLKKPYGRVVRPEPDGTYMAEIVEFPGCVATGDTPADALANLESVAETWLDAVLSRGQSVPPPTDGEEFSGKLLLRLPKSLHRRAAQWAARDAVSLNQFVVAAVAERVGANAAANPTGPQAFAASAAQPSARLTIVELKPVAARVIEPIFGKVADLSAFRAVTSWGADPPFATVANSQTVRRQDA